ncbi:PorP/SprF family type IX secretion system membrane protein [Fulvivirga lutimaris]|uniref:PorP/SprF family type IX secretion system membrane protein n=1 Tax=Fulvivirga lutimaris TaxID=1819566 RepID=UPI0012BD0ED0|nr:type IX secretion system membrane protein PorP/SprF [Fulvivirga lutimaris]MTI39612.1 type IX secretion system membrane protein PorP/SprF [Fulvivirga lutimaris]
MRKIIFYIWLGANFFNVQHALAQQDAQFSYYMKNMLYYNPAFAGSEGITQITLLHRTQWAGYASTFDDGGAPQTQVFSVTTPIYKFRSGFGAHIVNDNLGPLNNLEVQMSYAYHLGIKNSKLSFGLRMGVFSQSIDYDQYRAIQPDDPALIDKSGKESQVRPDMALGVYFRSEKYYVGGSFNHVLKSEFDFGVNNVRNALENHAYLTLGYIHNVNFDLKLSPSMMVQTDFNEYSFIIGGLAYYKDTMWGGASFRQGDDVNILLGYNFLKDKSLSFGYSFGYVIKDQDAKQATTHEVLLSYQLPVNPGTGKKVVRTPRFRH